MAKTHCISIYLPSTMKDGKPIPLVDRLGVYQSLIRTMADYFGGVTTTEGQGYFILANTNLQCEEVTIFTSYMTEVEMDEHLETLRIMMGEAKLILNQESWAYALDNTMYFL